MELKVILGTPPTLPECVDADVIRSLRGPDGNLGCAEGVSRAVEWIGDRSLPLDEALALAKADAGISRWWAEDVAWAEIALGVNNCGYGDGFGFGDGYGDSRGSGDGDGDSDSRGYGYGYDYVDSCFDCDGYGDYGYGHGGYGYGRGLRC